MSATAIPTGTRLTSKLLAIVAASLLSAVALAVMVVRPASSDVAASRQAARQVLPLAHVKQFTRAALDHRRAAADFIQSLGRVGRTDLERRIEPVETALSGLERATVEAGETPRVEVAALRSTWESMKAEMEVWARAGNVEAWWAKSAELSILTRRLTSDLIGTSPQEPGREVISVLLHDADIASEAGLRSVLAARAGRMDRTSEARVQRLTGLFERHSAVLADTYREPTGRSRIESLTREQSPARAEFARRIDEVLRKPVELDEDIAPGVLRAAERTVELDLDLFEQFAALRFEHLTERASAGRSRIAMSISALAFGLAFTLLAAYIVARSLLRQSDALYTAIKRFGAGDTASRAAITSGDEVGRLAVGFNAALEARFASSKSPVGLPGDTPREVGWLAKVIEDVADQASVQALNVSLRVAEVGDPAAVVSKATEELEALTERCANAARQLAELAGTRA